jgi:DNA-binding NarL/FixJ family response regulator
LPNFHDEQLAKPVHGEGTWLEVISNQEEIIVIDLDQVKVTPRDQQVLNLLVQGCSNKEIAGQLNISPRTVKQHLRTLFLRAGIREGRKRVKLAIAMYAKEESQS